MSIPESGAGPLPNSEEGPAPELAGIVDLGRFEIEAPSFREACRQRLAADGVLVLPGFLCERVLVSLKREAAALAGQAFYTTDRHNVFIAANDPKFPPEHPRNRLVVSSKGCITDDVVPGCSPLRALYDSPAFRDFLCAVLGETSLHEYADPLSSINVHYASNGQELGWHFDNSSFAVTLLLQAPEAGGEFQYVSAVRDADAGEMNYSRVEKVLDGAVEPETLSLEAGALVLFRGRNAMHRVTPVAGERTRVLVVLAYNTAPGVALSESARMTFYGRTG